MAEKAEEEVTLAQYGEAQEERGAPVTVFCTECGKAMQSDWKFCRVCGAKSQSVPQILAPTSIASVPSSSLMNRNNNDNNHPSMNRSDMAVRIGDRLIYDFEKHYCCPCTSDGLLGLHERVKDQLPLELQSKGISEKEWNAWMIALDEIQEKKSPSICCVFTTLCIPAGFIQCFLCAICCPLSSNHCLSCLPCCFGDWHQALREWQETVNERLKPLGCLIKLVTYKPHHKAPESALKASRISGKDGGYEMGFMVVALTERESIIVDSEGWDHGVNDHCCSGRGRVM